MVKKLEMPDNLARIMPVEIIGSTHGIDTP